MILCLFMATTEEILGVSYGDFKCHRAASGRTCPVPVRHRADGRRPEKQLRRRTETRAGKGHRKCCDGRIHRRAGHCRDPKLHRYHRSDGRPDRRRRAEPETGRVHRHGRQYRHHRHGADHPPRLHSVRRKLAAVAV